MDRTLTIFIYVWVGLAAAVNFVAVAGLVLGADGIWDAWNRVTGVYSPFNVVNWLMEMLLLSPAIAAYAWRDRRRDRLAHRTK